MHRKRRFRAVGSSRLAFGLALISSMLALPAVGALPSSLEWDPEELIQFNLPRGEGWWMALRSLAFPFEGSILSLVYSSDGQTIFASSEYGELASLDVESGRILWSLPAAEHNLERYILAVSPDGRSIATSQVLSRAVDGESLEERLAPPLEIRDAATGLVQRQLRGTSRFLHFHEDDGIRYDVSDFRRTKDTLDFFEETGYLLFSMIAVGASYSPDGKSLLVTWANDREDLKLIDRQLQLLDTATWKELWHWQYIGDNRDNCSSGSQNAKIGDGVFYSPAVMDWKGMRILHGLPDGEIREASLDLIKRSMKVENIHDKEAGRLLFSVRREANSQVSSISVHPDGKHILFAVSLDGEEYIQCFDSSTGRTRFKTPRLFLNTWAAFTPDGEGVISGGMGLSHFLAWDGKGRLCGDWPRFGRMGVVAINPVLREMAASSGASVLFFGMRKRAEGSIKPGRFLRTGAWIREGVDVVISGPGILRFKSGGFELDHEYEGIIEGYLSSSEELYDFSEEERWGEIGIMTDEPGKLIRYGGLIKAEYESVRVLRAGLGTWK